MKKNILSIKDIKPKELESIFTLADECAAQKHKGTLEGKVMASLFFEPSTRTRLSFESAMIRLGGQVVGFQEGATSSAKKGETLADTIRVVSEYADMIVLRHPMVGSSRLAAKMTSLPLINAGDGSSEHPTQTLTDLYTVHHLFGKLTGLKVGILGDLLYARTAHSLCLGLAPFSPRLYFIAKESLMPPEITLEEMRENSIKFSFHKELSEILPKLDILYVTRMQIERHQEDHHDAPQYRITKKNLQGAAPHLKIFHPLPRAGEIAEEVDETPFQAYFLQAKMGLPLRQALCLRALCKN